MRDHEEMVCRVHVMVFFPPFLPSFVNELGCLGARMLPNQMICEMHISFADYSETLYNRQFHSPLVTLFCSLISLNAFLSFAAKQDLLSKSGGKLLF